jgi:hypothetical protein
MATGGTRQTGWAGMIMLLVVVLIIGFLASSSLKQYLGVGGGRQVPAAAAADSPTTAPVVPATPIERARSVGDMMQKQAEEQSKKIDEAESK